MKMDRLSHDSGVAEIVGSLMLIAIIGLGVAIAGVYLLNHSVPEKIPEFRASLANTSTSLTLHHDGGESIPRSSFIILVNGNPTGYDSSNTSSPDWSIDETLTFFSYDPATPLPDVKIVYNGSAGERYWLISVLIYHTLCLRILLDQPIPRHSPASLRISDRQRAVQL